MGLLETWIHRKEHEGAEIHAPLKDLHEFEWGLDHLGIPADSGDPLEVLRAYTRHNIENSHSYFVPDPPPLDSFRLEGNELVFPSPITTFDPVNNMARCRYFPHRTASEIILVVPPWNAPASKADGFCRLINRLGYGGLSLSLPFHDNRGFNPENQTAQLGRSTLMVSANIGLTILSMQQAVQDLLASITWLEAQGHRRIAVMGASIGSCVAFLAANHDPRIRAFFANLMSSYFGEVVWTGISTTHIRRSVEHHLNLEQLRELWLLNSPIAFVKAMKTHNPELRQFIVSGRYDLSFRYYLTEKMLEAYRTNEVPFEVRTLPCGHYSLSKYWFRYAVGWYIYTFFNDIFRSAGSAALCAGPVSPWRS